MPGRAAPVGSPALDVAIIGAGLSGLACGRALVERGHRIRVFDKGRGVGGRMATRRSGKWRFDHGAQYFTARDERFDSQVQAWLEAGLAARWEGVVAVLENGLAKRKSGGPARFVGVPGMSAICRHLAAELAVASGTRVVALHRLAGGWRLVSNDDADLGTYDAVVIAAPAPQTAELLAGVAPRMSADAAAVEMTPCWAVMAAFAEPIHCGFDAAFVNGSPLGWVARNCSKPGRPGAEAWVLHGSPDWSRRHLELAPGGAAERLLEAFFAASGVAPAAPVHLAAHLWRFALPQALQQSCLFDADLELAACGDWCGGPRVEGAFLSGSAAADRLLAQHPGTSGTARRAPARLRPT